MIISIDIDHFIKPNTHSWRKEEEKKKKLSANQEERYVW